MNPARVSVLDIDVDISGIKRAQVLEHLRKFYGENRVSNVATFKLEKSKSAILTACRGLGIDVDKYKTETYEAGNIYQEHYETFDDVVNIGVVQIYYRPKDYSLTIEYLNDED